MVLTTLSSHTGTFCPTQERASAKLDIKGSLKGLPVPEMTITANRPPTIPDENSAVIPFSVSK